MPEKQRHRLHLRPYAWLFVFMFRYHSDLLKHIQRSKQKKNKRKVREKITTVNNKLDKMENKIEKRDGTKKNRERKIISCNQIDQMKFKFYSVLFAFWLCKCWYILKVDSFFGFNFDGLDYFEMLFNFILVLSAVYVYSYYEIKFNGKLHHQDMHCIFKRSLFCSFVNPRREKKTI